MVTKSSLPRLDWVTVKRNGTGQRLPYCFCKGTTGRALMFIHGLGVAKENFRHQSSGGFV